MSKDEKFANTALSDALKVEVMAGKVKPAALPANVARRGFVRQIHTEPGYTPFPKEVPSDGEIAELAKTADAKTPATIETADGQRLVNRRRVAKPDFLRNGAPLDLGWVRGQVDALRGLKIASHKIVNALDRVGVRRGDGSYITVADVERWGQEA